MKVAPAPHETDGIPISSLNPDTDGDGQVAAWEKETYDRIVRADQDGSGSISVKELFSVIKGAADEVREAQKGGLAIASLDPDTDGDGRVEKWEAEVFKRIQLADEDKSGSISVKEVSAALMLLYCLLNSRTASSHLTPTSHPLHTLRGIRSSSA